MPSDPRKSRRSLRLPVRSARRIQDDLDDELRFHYEMRTRELIERGMGEPDARREALREFGDLDALRRSCAAEDRRADRAARRSAWAEDLWQDLAHAWRAMRRSRGFAAVTAVTLALGIGANTAIFSVVHRVLLASLPYREPERLVRVYGRHADDPLEHGQISAGDFVDLQREQRSLSDLAAMMWASFTYTGGVEPTRLAGARVSPNMFDVLGVRPAAGRAFTPGDDADGVVILAHSAWQRVFGGDPAVVGKAVPLNGVQRTVVGVLPANFVWPEGEVEAWVPLDLRPALADPNRTRKFHFLGAIGRLRPGVSAGRAEEDLLRIARRLEREYPESNDGMLVAVLSLRDAIVGQVRPALLVLTAAAAVVLVIACANVAAILLARTAARGQELAVRAALGAGRGRLARQLLTESLLVALVGGALGVLLAFVGSDALVKLAGSALPDLGDVRVDGRVLLFALAVSVASGLLFGAAPALAGNRRDLHESLRDSSRSASAGGTRLRARRILVVGQMALAVTLLVGAGLLVKSLGRLRGVQLGFDATRLLTFEVDLPRSRYEAAAKEDAFFAALLQRLRAIPGVLSAATGGALPLTGGASASLTIQGRPVPAGAPPEVRYNPVSDDYFATLRIRLARGRAFDRRDTDSSPSVVILSEGAARKFWPNGDAIGARVRLGPDPGEPWGEVIGIVGDVRQEGVAAAPLPTAYVSHRQDHWGFARVVVRGTGDPRLLQGAVRQALREVDPGLPLVQVRTMDEIVASDLSSRRLPTVLLSGFAVLALVLAAVGVYGVTAFAVTSRTREFGVRMALGAEPASVLALVIKQGASAALVGVGLGMVGALAGARLLASLLYEVRPLDPGTLVAAAAVLGGATLIACYVPARRATRVDPVIALRSD